MRESTGRKKRYLSRSRTTSSRRSHSTPRLKTSSKHLTKSNRRSSIKKSRKKKRKKTRINPVALIFLSLSVATAYYLKQHVFNPVAEDQVILDDNSSVSEKVLPMVEKEIPTQMKQKEKQQTSCVSKDGPLLFSGFDYFSSDSDFLHYAVGSLSCLNCASLDIRSDDPLLPKSAFCQSDLVCNFTYPPVAPKINSTYESYIKSFELLWNNSEIVSAEAFSHEKSGFDVKVEEFRCRGKCAPCELVFSVDISNNSLLGEILQIILFVFYKVGSTVKKRADLLGEKRRLIDGRSEDGSNSESSDGSDLFENYSPTKQKKKFGVDLGLKESLRKNFSGLRNRSSGKKLVSEEEYNQMKERGELEGKGVSKVELTEKEATDFRHRQE
eukprot:snap_masked-scaffold_2-processed-gene-7.46-mRNA-1 protein AED:1.00 eAED:1.00 QI:0/0/0/0/1/1/2/0/382